MWGPRDRRGEREMLRARRAGDGREAPPAGDRNAGRPGRERIPRHERLRAAAEIREVRASGRCVPGRTMTLYVADSRGYRFGVVAGRRVGLATRRNRARRLVREALRRLRPRLRGDRTAAVLVFARPEILRATGRDVQEELESLFARIGLLGPP